jgi:hypothetical protein
VNPPWKESRLAKLMTLPRRPVEGEGSSVSICAPTSRQSVKTVERFTWRTCDCQLSGAPDINRGSHLVPVIIWKLGAGMATLNSSAIDQNIDLVPVL